MLTKRPTGISVAEEMMRHALIRRLQPAALQTRSPASELAPAQHGSFHGPELVRSYRLNIDRRQIFRLAGRGALHFYAAVADVHGGERLMHRKQRRADLRQGTQTPEQLLEHRHHIRDTDDRRIDLEQQNVVAIEPGIEVLELG